MILHNFAARHWILVAIILIVCVMAYLMSFA
jgi:Ca2+-dependent lipid-binding protein